MTATRYENIVDLLLNLFPAYKETKEFKEIFTKEDYELSYMVWGHFIREYILVRFKKHGGSDKEVQRLFDFVNTQFSDADSDPKVLDLLAIEVFEQFAGEWDSLRYARSNTNKEARFALETAMWGTGVDAPDPIIAPDAAKRRQEIMDQKQA